MSRALLVLADGTEFAGRSVGAAGPAVGEAVFNTTMTGYQEVVTDPSYAGQIVTMTAPHIGNYGVTNVDDQRAAPALAGLVMRALSRVTSSWRAEGPLDEFLLAHGIAALSDVDTRRLTRHIRANGAMAAAMGAGMYAGELLELATGHGSMAGRNLAADVTIGTAVTHQAEGASRGLVVAYDLGMKRDIAKQLSRRGLEVVMVPADTTAAETLAYKPDGVFLSNGPGDPEPVTATITAVADLLGEVPVFGICLGHQILGLALGARTYKLPFGHHGGNHPVLDLARGSVEVTSQNHGFAVDLWSLTADDPPLPQGQLPGRELLPDRVESRYGSVVATHQNLNDGTLEGIACLDVPAFSVQYHPEAAPGPKDALHLFDRFAALIGATDAAA